MNVLKVKSPSHRAPLLPKLNTNNGKDDGDCDDKDGRHLLPNDGSDDNSNDGAESLYNINAPIPPLGDSIIENVGVCVGVDSGNFGSMLSYAAVSMKNTAQKLLKWRAEEDGGRKSYLASTLAKSKDFVLPFRNMILQKQSNGD